MHAEPEKFVGAIGLIRHPIDCEHRWLAIWNPQREFFDFVTAQRLDGDTYRECLDREVAWQLPLNRGKDYLISSVARLHLDASIAVTDRPDPKQFSVELFVVDLYGKQSRRSVARDPAAHWISTSELLAGTTDRNQQISPTLVSILRKADVFPPTSNF